MTDHIDISREGRVQTIRITRPEKKNALTAPMYKAMTDALLASDEDASLSATVLMGQPGAFTAGNDINEFANFARSGGLGEEVLGFLNILATAKKPLIAAVDGFAVGVGTTLLFHCDLVYASTRSTFKTPFLNLALVPEAASSLLMPQTMGHQRAFAMLALGEEFSAQAAHAAGFVNHITSEAEVEAMARASAGRLAAMAPEALVLTKALMRGYDITTVKKRMADEAEHFAGRLRSSEAGEAFSAFLEKRQPDFGKTGT